MKLFSELPSARPTSVDYSCPISLRLLLLATAILFLTSSPAFTQSANRPKQNLPSADRIVEQYVKAIGGKKRLMALTDASYEWTVELNGQPLGTAQSQLKPPYSSRSELTFANGKIITAANASSAWELGLDGNLRTLTGAEANVAKLQAALEASHLLNYKKVNVLARVTSRSDASEPSYTVEFSTRNGARLAYWFSLRTGLLIKVTDDVRKIVKRFDEYRNENGVLEPHRVLINIGDSADLLMQLQRVSYNNAFAVTVFDAPAAGESLDLPGLLREVSRNQDEVEKRVTEYSFLQKETDREINSKGEVKKESVKVYEIFPVANREPIQKLISENGVALSADRAAREEKRVQEEFVKAERDREKDEQKEARRRAERQKKDENKDDPEISQFLRVCEFVSARRERFDDREAIVFDFRPRPGFRPKNREEALIAKLVGTVWIDPVDKQVMRLEARLAEGFKMAGGLLLSLKPGAALAMEQTRMVEGVWLPRLAQINLSVKVLLFGGGDFNKTIEWSDYRHFKGDVTDYKIESPKSDPKSAKP